MNGPSGYEQKVTVVPLLIPWLAGIAISHNNNNNNNNNNNRVKHFELTC